MPATLTRTYHGSPVKVFNSNGGQWYYAYPSLCRTADGKLRIVCYRSPQTSGPHYPGPGSIDDGNLVTRVTTGSHDGSTWETTDTLMPCNIPGVIDNRTGQLLRLANGDEAYVWFTHNWYGSGGDTTDNGAQTIGHFSRSSDGWQTCTDPVVVACKWRDGSPNALQFVASSICELPNEDLLVATFAREALNQDKWDGRIARSTDGGATWTDEGLVIGWEFAGYNVVEQQLVLRPDGKLAYYFHTEDNQYGSGTQRGWVTIGTFAGTYGALTWTTPTLVASNSWNKQGACLGPDGDIVLAYAPNNQFQVFKQSNSGDGVTFDTAREITASRSIYTAGEMYSQWVSPAAIGDPGVDGNVGIAWGLGTGDLTQNCSVFFQAYTAAGEAVATGYGDTVSSGYGEADAYAPTAILTIDPASTAWEQIGTQVTVRTTADPSIVEATVTSPGGGLVRFRGADAAYFAVSLDAVSWASTVEVPDGDTLVHLRVTPSPLVPGVPSSVPSSLTAEIGVPV